MDTYIIDDGTLTELDFHVAPADPKMARDFYGHDIPSRFIPNTEIKDIVRILGEVREIETERVRQFFDKK